MTLILACTVVGLAAADQSAAPDAYFLLSEEMLSSKGTSAPVLVGEMRKHPKSTPLESSVPATTVLGQPITTNV
jgi:hypothetical protein